MTTQNQKHRLSIVLCGLGLLLLSTCQPDPPDTRQGRNMARRAPILLLGSQLTIDDRVAPTRLFSQILEQRLQYENPNYKIVNGGIARETTSQLASRWPQLKGLNAKLVILELPAGEASSTDNPAVEQLLQTILETQSASALLLWIPPALGQPLPLQLAEQFQVSIIEIPVKNEDWDVPDALHRQVAEQLWPALQQKLKNMPPD